MESESIVLVALAALLVGCLIPVLVQLRATLRALQRGLEVTGKRADEVLEETRRVAHNANHLVEILTSDGRLDEALASLERLAHAMERIRGTIDIASAVGAAVGPAVTAFVQSLGEDGGPRGIERGSKGRGNGFDEDDEPRSIVEERHHEREHGKEQ